MRMTGIVLAAGKSCRLGRDKLSVVMPDGRSLAAWSLEAALNSEAGSSDLCSQTGRFIGMAAYKMG